MDFFLKCLAAFVFYVVIDLVAVAECISAYGKDQSKVLAAIVAGGKKSITAWSSMLMSFVGIAASILLTGSFWLSLLIAYAGGRVARVIAVRAFKLEEVP